MKTVSVMPHRSYSVCVVCNTFNSRLADTWLLQTPVIRTAAKSPTKINYRRLTEINSRYYGLSLLRTLTYGPEGVPNKGS